MKNKQKQRKFGIEKSTLPIHTFTPLYVATCGRCNVGIDNFSTSDSFKIFSEDCLLTLWRVSCHTNYRLLTGGWLLSIVVGMERK